MWHRLRWSFGQIRHTLWARPLLYATLAIAAAVACLGADRYVDARRAPLIELATVEGLLAIIATSMLSVATLAVASMVAAYASAGSTATPRAFSLVIADDVSQTALSGFIGAFIFSIVALISVKTGVYGRVGVFLIFLLTVSIFALVILVFLRWVDRIARLGRLGNTVDLVERAAAEALDQRRQCPTLGASRRDPSRVAGTPVYTSAIGYVQSIDMRALQRCCVDADVRVAVEALPGTFIGPGRSLAVIDSSSPVAQEVRECVVRAFIVGDDRTFREDPRFGLVTLAEVAARALSPAVNDVGTAIDIVGTFVRLLARWADATGDIEVLYDRVSAPAVTVAEMFDDAFTAISRDGAGLIELQIRLQKAFISLAATGNRELQMAAVTHARRAQARAALALRLPEEHERISALLRTVEQAAATDVVHGAGHRSAVLAKLTEAPQHDS